MPAPAKIPLDEPLCVPVSELARALGVSPDKVKLAAKGELPGFPPPVDFLGTKVWYVAAVRRWLDNQSGIASDTSGENIDRSIDQWDGS